MAELKRSEFEGDFADTTYSNQRLAAGVYVGTKGAGLDWFAALVDMLASVDDRIIPLAGPRVYKDSTDSALQCSVAAGKFVHNGTVVSYAGATNQTLTDATANYLFLTHAAALVINTTGWPSYPHLRLAVITPAAGAFDDPTQIVDWRAANLFRTTDDDRIQPLADGLVYKHSTDTALQCSVAATKFVHNAAVVSYAGATNQSLTDDSANYIYLTAAGSLVINTTGWPSAPHVRLAVITTASGSWDRSTLVDWRNTAILQTTCSTPQLTVAISAGAEAADTRAVTIQVKDAAGGNKAGVFTFQIWLADTQGPLAESATACTSWTATTGSLGDAFLGGTSKKSALVKTDSNGTFVMDLEYTGGAKTWYIEALIQSVHVSSDAIAFAA